MKKKLLVIALSVIVAIAANSQTVSIGFESGYSINHTAIAGINLGLGYKGFVIRTGFDAHLSNKVNDGIVIQNKIGYTSNLSQRFYLSAFFGHAYLYKSADNKSLNKSEYLWNPEIGYKCELANQPFALYIGGTKAGEMKMIAGGIRGYF